MQHKLDALLVFPPFVSAVVDSVYPSVYFLANYLRQSGFRADWWDMNRDSLSLVLERYVIDAEITHLSSTLRDYEEHGHLSPAFSGHIYTLLDSVHYGTTTGTRDQGSFSGDHCREARFSFGQVNIIYDIPTTTYKEALSVLEFCKSYKDIAPMIQLFPFQLTSTSSMASDPDKYGILIGGPDTAQHGTFLTTAIPFMYPHGMNDNERSKIRALYHDHYAEVMDDHAYGGLMRTILKARHLSDLDAYTFCFLDEKCFHVAETSITSHYSGHKIQPRKLLYYRDGHEVFEISNDAMILLRAVSGKELSIHNMSALIRTACPFVTDVSVVLEFVKLCAAARLIEWCAHRNGHRMYAAPEFLPEWRRILDDNSGL
jgi:hypothetical protein